MLACICICSMLYTIYTILTYVHEKWVANRFRTSSPATWKARCPFFRNNWSRLFWRSNDQIHLKHIVSVHGLHPKYPDRRGAHYAGNSSWVIPNFFHRPERQCSSACIPSQWMSQTFLAAVLLFPGKMKISAIANGIKCLQRLYSVPLYAQA